MKCSEHPEWNQPSASCPDCLWDAAGKGTRLKPDERERMLKEAVDIAATSVPPVIGKVVLILARDHNLWKAIAAAREWVRSLGGSTYAGA